MKKTVYYLSPFVIVPMALLLCEFLTYVNIINQSPYVIGITLFVVSVIIGNLSPEQRTFDYIMTVLMPLSLLCTMFIVGFLDKDDMETRFHFYKAFKAAFQTFALQYYFMMAVSTFLASFKAIRINRIVKRNRAQA